MLNFNIKYDQPCQSKAKIIHIKLLLCEIKTKDREKGNTKKIFLKLKEANTQ